MADDPPVAPPVADVTARTPDPDATSRRGDKLPPVVLPPPTGGRYVLGPEIAHGGMGAVFRATDTALGREVALKLLQEQFATDSGTARRFADEAHITGQLQHPSIPPVHDFGTFPDGRPFLAMKLVKGDTLHDLLKARRDPAADRGRFVAVFEAVCQAVGYAHAHGVIHRDLKPANVMVGAFGEVQVMDWGLAKVLRAGDTAAATDADATAPNTEVRAPRDAGGDHTTAGSVMGTLPYMPPEQAAGAAHKATPRSDVFGLGAVLTVILTGRPPFEGGASDTARVKAAQGDVADCLARLDACGAEPELVALCKRCLSPKPADRPADAGEVAEFRAEAEARARQAELDRVKAEGERATAEATAAEGRKRRRVQLVLAAAVVLIVAGAGGVAAWRAAEEGKNRTETARREGEERERATRHADAVAALLDQAKAALEAGNADRAAPFLDQATSRAADGAVADHADRLAAYRGDLAVLRDLDAVDNFRLTPNQSGYPPWEKVVERWRAALDGYGIVPGTAPAECGARINRSPIRAAVVAALDGWLAWAPSEPVRAVLDAADPDPFRTEVRGRLAAWDGAGVAGLIDRPEWADQPAGLVMAYAASRVVPAADARRLLTRVVAGRPDDFGLLMQLGRTYPINTPDRAADRARWFQAATALRRGNPFAHNSLGNALLDQGDLDGATASYREAIRLDPKFALPHTGLGNVLHGKGDLAGATASYRKAILLDPKLAHAHSGLGRVYHDKRVLEVAAASFREAIHLDPKFAFAHNGLGSVYYEKGNLEGAVASFREAVRLDPEYANPHGGLGSVYYAKGDLDGAAASFREAVRLNPKDARAHTGLGNVLQGKGDPAGATASYREAIRLDPKYALPHSGLGNVLHGKGDLAGATASYREAVRLDPKLAHPHTSLGLIHEVQHQLDQAEAAYREAVRLNPRYTVALVNLGNVLRKQGRHADAVESYRAALAIQPFLADARAGLNYCLRVLRGEVPTAPPPRAVAR